MTLPGVLVLVLSAAVAAAAPRVVATDGALSPIGTLSTLSDPSIDRAGRVAFLGTSRASFQAQPSGLVHLFAAGDTVTLATTETVFDVGPPVLDGAGCVVGYVGYRGGSGIFRRCGESTRAVALVGTRVGETTIRGLGPTVVAGDGGEVAFLAQVDGGATAVVVAGSGSAREVVRTGQPSPRGGTFIAFRLVGVTAAGAVGVRATVDDGPDGFYVSGPDGRLTPVVVVNDPSPASGEFTALGEATLNADNQWAFRARVSVGNLNGIFRADVSGGRTLLSVAALEGDATPIGGSYRQFPRSLVPSINSSGAIAFRATLDDTLFGSAVFVIDRSATARKVVAAAESTPAGQLVQFRTVLLADDGSVLCQASLVGGGGGFFVVDPQTGIRPLAQLGAPTDLGGRYRFTAASVRATAAAAVFAGQREAVFVAPPSGGVRAVAVVGERTPRGGVYAAFDPPTAASGGRVVFHAVVQGGRTSDALFLTRNGRPTTLISAGARATKRSAFVEFLSGGLGPDSRIDVSGGTVAFEGRLKGPQTASGLFVLARGKVRVLARTGSLAPGGGRYAVFGAPTLGSGGATAFVARLADSGADTGVFLQSGARARAVALAGDDTLSRLGGRFDDFDGVDAGVAGVAFQARLRSGREAIFLHRGRRRGLLVAAGDPAPGGGRFTDFGAPVLMGRAAVITAGLGGATASAGLFRVAAERVPALADPPAAAETVALTGDASPAGGSILGFGAPSADRRGGIAVTVALTAAASGSAIVVFPR